MTYELKTTDGRNITIDSLDEAYAILGGDIILHDDWEPCNYDGTRERLLVWASEYDADNCSGADAIASIIRDAA